ncbi:MAG: hypothetical protein ACYTKD_32240 [Planctomycetota bacterium]|jgi:hypothetical protein
MWVLEEKYLGPIGLASVLPDGHSSGRLRVTMAGPMAVHLGGFEVENIDGDVEKLAMLTWLEKDGKKLVRQARAATELLLRIHWSGLLRVADLLRNRGTLSGRDLVLLRRAVLEGPIKPLDTDVDIYVRLCEALDGVPEIGEWMTAGLLGAHESEDSAAAAR